MTKILTAAFLFAATVAHADSSVLTIENNTSSNDTVFVAFGSDSTVRSFPGCAAPSCSFPLAAKTKVKIPLAGYLNATISFNAAVTCGVTKAELNINNPKWYDVVDVSLVDGFSNKVSITIDGKKLGPPVGASGNEKVYGVFPLECDICVARQSPPCGMKPGGGGCKAGSQYSPKPPCQHQGKHKGGGSAVLVTHEG